MKKKCQIPKNSILRKIQGYFRLLSASSDDYFFATDMKTNVIMVSPNMVTDFAMPAETFVDMNEEWLPRIHPDDYDAYVKELFKEYTTEDNLHNTIYRVRDIRDNYVWVCCRGQVSFDSITGKPELFAGIIKTLERENQADANTGLLTRCQFEQAVKNALRKNEEKEIPPGAVMFFGLDNFKIINESYNRRFGNIMLKLAAGAIAKALPEGIMVYRLDGDEFATVIPGMDAAGAQELFEAVQRSFCRPQYFTQHQLPRLWNQGHPLVSPGHRHHKFIVLYILHAAVGSHRRCLREELQSGTDFQYLVCRHFGTFKRAHSQSSSSIYTK